VASAKAEFKEVEAKAVKMEESCKAMGKLFGEATAKPEEIFAIFSAFIDSYKVFFFFRFYKYLTLIVFLFSFFILTRCLESQG